MATGVPRAGPWLAAILPGLCAVALYAETLGSPWQYDDWVTIVDQPALASLRTALSSWGAGEAVRPVTAASYAVDAAWGRLTPEVARRHPAAGSHATNVLLHTLVVILVAVIALRWWGDPLAAGLAALVVAAHPFNAEAVNYLSARASLLAACGELAALGAYTLWASAGRRNRLWLAASLGSAIFALGAKESAVTLPLLLWLTDRFVIAPQDSWRIRMRRLWPWWALAGGYLLIRVVIPADVAGGMSFSEGGRGAAWFTALWVVGLGARDWLWPTGLSVEHGVETVSPAGGVLVAALALAVALAVGWSWTRWHRAGSRRGVPLAWIVGWWTSCALPAMILPFITHVALYQENRFYLAGVGMAMGVGRAGALGWGWARARWGTAVPVVLGGLALVGLVLMTHARNEIWKTEVGLWTDAVSVAPRSALAHNMLGVAHLAQHRPELALPELEAAVRLDPGYPRAATNLGAAYAMQRRWGEAIAQFQRALELEPAFETARRNLADAYEQSGQLPEALAAYDALRRKYPDDPEMALRFGGVAVRLHAWSLAEEAFRAVLTRDDRSYPALFNLGLAAEGQGRWEEAERWYRQAAAVNASDPDVPYRLGLIAARTGRDDEALSAFQAALQLSSDHVLAHVNLARLYDRRGQADRAAEHYRAFLRAAPPGPEWTAPRREAEDRLRARGR
jgi:tetratricopeptide (TPR) repeat protein